jgi:alpha-1,6-mannosyltransferase
MRGVPRDGEPHDGAGRPRPHLRLVRPPALRIVDVALFYGERSGGIRTYLDAKRRVLRDDPDAEHHLVVPGPRERHDDGRHELPSVRCAHLSGANGYRVPLGVRALKDTLRDLRPDVVLLHDPFWAVLGVAAAARAEGACVVAVHHTSPDLDAAGLPGPDALWKPVMRRWFRRAYRRADVVMSAGDTLPDTGRTAALPLRFGVDPAFRPQPGVRREGHVLYAGRIGREKGLDTLLEAAARPGADWTLELVGDGACVGALTDRARRLGIERRVSFHPHEASPSALARRFAAAGCVVMPGPFETFGLVGLEAAACGARVVASATAPAVRSVGPLAHTFAPGDAAGLARAIAAARTTDRDLAAAGALAARSTWAEAIGHELEDLRTLLTGGRRWTAAPGGSRAA